MEIAMSHAIAARSERPILRLPAEEIERRCKIVRRANHEKLLEDTTRDPATDNIFEAFSPGKIEVRKLEPRFKEFPASSRAWRVY